VTNGRTIIEFSGDASHIKEAFHTEIHKYLVHGEEHWANASDPLIPAALTPVVFGVASLNDFSREPTSRRVGAFTMSKTTGKVTSRRPAFTSPSSTGCGPILVITDCFVVGPTDFATIYNVLPLWNANIDGTGVTVAVIGDSNINPQDAHNFRSIFGLPTNDPKVVLAGADPGISLNEGEADLDTQWSGAVAKGATIDLVIAADTNATFGGDIAAEFVINHNLASILSESFGTCELYLGTSGNQMYNTLWQQAATQGITVLLPAGDSGSAGCEEYLNLPATTGLAVNGLASTPFNTAVGGTDFDQFPNPLLFWNTTNNPTTLASATGYIPETTWNDSCTNQIWVLLGFDPTPEASCNDTKQSADFIGIAGGGGGVSSCTSSDGQTPSSCSGGYTKPPWQSGPGVPNDGHRDLPDVSLFAGDLLNSSSFVCQQDRNTGNAPCSTSAFITYLGTSVSVQAFAGIVALIDQKTNSRQGLINPTLYTLAAAAGNSCASAANPGVNCVFYDVIKGTNAQPCAKGSPNCPAPTNPAYTNSILSADNGVTQAYDAVPGYDLATGLGTVNVSNLVNNWPTGGINAADFTMTAANSTVNVSSPGGSGTMTINLAAQNGFTGIITISPAACVALPTAASCSFDKASVTLNGITQTDSTTLTVKTTAPSMLTPASRSRRFEWPGSSAIIAIAFCMSILSLKCRSKTGARGIGALAVLLLALLITTASCGNGGGGSGGGGNGGGGNGGGSVGGTPVGTTNAVVTFTAGGSTHSLVFTVNVQ
jgi:subtilase family serine protease